MDESFRGSLTVPLNQNVILGTPDQTEITIVDDDGKTHGCHTVIVNNSFLIITASTVEFANAPYAVMEGSGVPYNVCLSIDPVCDLEAVVTLETAPKDAVRKLIH